MLQNEMVCVHHFEREKDCDSDHDIFFDKIWDRDGAREGFVERFLYWKLCITPWEVANNSVPVNGVGTVSSVLQTVFISLLWFGYLQAAHSYAYLWYLKILSGAAANSEILFYN